MYIKCISLNQVYNKKESHNLFKDTIIDPAHTYSYKTFINKVFIICPHKQTRYLSIILYYLRYDKVVF